MTRASFTKDYALYTDGACSGNPGPGGWAAVLVSDVTAAWYAGHEERTTNNRMEILAVIKGLEHLPAGSPVTVFSDSQYVVYTMTRGWQRKANLDLWGRLDTLTKDRKVSWEWVLGHAGNLFNEEANRLAQAAASDPNWGERSGQWGKEGPSIESMESMESMDPATPRLSHLDDQGRAHMVDVSDKEDSHREAVAKGTIYMSPETLSLIQEGGVGKGDVFTVAQVAGVMAAKRTSEIIPLCHPLPLTHIDLAFAPDAARSCVEVTATVRTTAKTGVEMEALTAVFAAALTIYDMCKAVDRAMRITDIRVTHKEGGKSGLFQQE